MYTSTAGAEPTLLFGVAVPAGWNKPWFSKAQRMTFRYTRPVMFSLAQSPEPARSSAVSERVGAPRVVRAVVVVEDAVIGELVEDDAVVVGDVDGICGVAGIGQRKGRAQDAGPTAGADAVGVDLHPTGGADRSTMVDRRGKCR